MAWPTEPNDNPLGDYKHAAISCDAGPCSEVGKEMLTSGGSAVDAAIATLFCMGVFHPQSMGIGGGGLMTIYERRSRKAFVIDARETAPAASHESVYTANPRRTVSGGLAVAIPGEVKGYWEAHSRFGRLPWKELVQPAIKMCLDGVEVSGHLAHALRAMKRTVVKEPSLREVFVNPKTGSVCTRGDVIFQPVLAETLRAIGDGGAEVFYGGQIGQNIIHDLHKFGASMTMDDLRNYTALTRDALRIQLRNGVHVYTPPPPGCGPVLSHILHTMDGYDFNSYTLSTDKNATLFAHYLAEVLKFAFAKRSELGDPAFVDVNDVITKLMSRSYGESVRKRIKKDSVLPDEMYGTVTVDASDIGTAHLSVLAANGDAVSATSSINTWLGSGIRSKSTGVTFNNEMDDFSFPTITNHFGVPPSVANFMRPGKRPQSSMSPSIFVEPNGDVVLVIGAAGGTRILSAVTQTVARVMWMGQSLKEAIDARRIHHQLIPNEIQVEEGVPEAVTYKLRKLGHNIAVHTARGSSVNAIHRTTTGRVYAYADFRKDGSTAGF